MNFFVLVFLFGVSFQAIDFTGAENVIVCYYASWAVYRPPGGKVDVDNIDPTLCTHLIYTFVGITADGNVKVLDSWHDIDLRGFEKFNELKLKNPKLKTLASIGGWNEASTNFSPVAANPVLRNTFAKNVVKFLDKYKFDGLDVDWEYPADRGGVPSDKVSFDIKENFTELLKALRLAMDSKILTITVGAGNLRRLSSYDVPNINKYVDFFNLMSYDLHGSWESKTGHNAPLRASSADVDKTLNIEYIVNDWIVAGASPSKLVLGLAAYGRSFTLADPSRNNFGAPTTGGGERGPYTREDGSLSYTEICSKLKNAGWKYVWDDEQQVPYAYSGNQWVGFDDIKSIGLKIDLAIKNNLKGVMLWSVDQDDVYNECGKGKFPLLQEINRKIFGSDSLIQINLSPILNVLQTATHTKRSVPISCSGDGFVADPSDCDVYYVCMGDDIITVKCPLGLVFNPETNSCAFSSNTPGC